MVTDNIMHSRTPPTTTELIEMLKSTLRDIDEHIVDLGRTVNLGTDKLNFVIKNLEKTL